MVTKRNKIINVFIIGSKSIGQYGGFETFVDKLTQHHQNEKRVQYHIACKQNGIGSMDETKLNGISNIKKNKHDETIEFDYHNAHVYKIKTPNIGAVDAIFYDVIALNTFIKFCKSNKINKPIFYILASRIGPFISFLKERIKRIGGYYCLNPDGHEWKRSKWSTPVKLYWKLSEKLMVKNADLIICDSLKIEEYINEEYKKYSPNTTYISYGSDLVSNTLYNNDDVFEEWINKNEIVLNNYYITVGRLVPENNYETIIREFIKSNTTKDLVLITNANEKYRNYLNRKLNISDDCRIKFVGTVYNHELLKRIRENAYANIHGHEVGGTNPSLLEALGSSRVNLLYDVGFNREVARDAALYWNKNEDCLKELINKVELMKEKSIREYEKKAKNRITKYYNWDLVSKKYLNSFTNLQK